MRSELYAYLAVCVSIASAYSSKLRCMFRELYAYLQCIYQSTDDFLMVRVQIVRGEPMIISLYPIFGIISSFEGLVPASKKVKKAPNHNSPSLFHSPFRLHTRTYTCILPQNALRRDCNGKCIEWIKGHYLGVVVEVYHGCVYIVSICDKQRIPWWTIERTNKVLHVR